METVLIQLTVYFDDPFWVGVVERHQGTRMEAARLVFGAEPKDYDVYRLLLDGFYTFRFSPSVETQRPIGPPQNPKRAQRMASRQMSQTGVGTKAQQALKLQQEQNKLERKAHSRQARDLEDERKFQLQQDKRREKHKGH